MRYLHFLVEGQTEEAIINSVVEPYYADKQIKVTNSLLKTKRSAGSNPAHKGGATSWEKIHTDIKILLRSTHLTVTTLLDYYAFPADAPGMATRPAGASAYERVAHVEAELERAIGSPRFIPHLVLHETEAWVLAACEILGAVTGDVEACLELGRVVAAENSPELINDGAETAPSKRILKACTRYRKTVDGPLVVAEIGIDRIRACCPHAHERLAAVEMVLGLSVPPISCTGSRPDN